MSIFPLLEKFHPFSVKQLFYIKSKIKSHILKEGEKIASDDNLNGDTLFYIESGIARQFVYTTSEEEETYWILGENQWVCDIESYVCGTPSTCQFEALTRVKCKSIQKAELQKLIEEFPVLKDFAIKVYEQYILILDRRNKIHRTKNARERYLKWESNYPDLANRVKLKYIAQFLNITPQQLSRIRKQRAESGQ